MLHSNKTKWLNVVNKNTVICHNFSQLITTIMFWTLSTVSSLSKNAVIFIFQNTTFGTLGSVSVFRR
jgi:hypothetical protein